MPKHTSPRVFFSLFFILALVGCTVRVSPTAGPLAQTATVQASPTSAPLPTATQTQPPTPTALPARPVSPVSGLPQGSEGYPWWNNTTFYEIFVRSFYDSNGDGIGDLQGILGKLDYLNDGNLATTTDLGVTALWLMPIYPAESYHGYDVTDYYSVNPAYGSLQDLKDLIGQAHQKGVRVILDMVLNHTSDHHPWFIDAQKPGSKYHDWYVWGGNEHAGDSHWHLAANGEYYYAQFGANMPDLNYLNPAVTTQMEDVVRFWLQEVGVDGFRLDAIRYLIEEGTALADTESTHAWLKGFREFYKKINPQAITVGEIWANTSTVTPYVEGDQLDLAFDFDLADAMVKAVYAKRADNAARVLTVDANWFKPLQFATFLTNHDQARSMSLFRNDVAKGKSAATMLLTSPGVPFIYYGEEIGMIGLKPDPMIRTPMQWSSQTNAGFTTGAPWESIFSDYPTKNVATESGNPDSLLSYYREMINLRDQHIALRLGEMIPLETGSASVLAYLRCNAEENILVVINLAPEPLNAYQLGVKSTPLKGTYQLAPLIGSGAFKDLVVDAQGGLAGFQPIPELEPNQNLVLQMQPK